MKQWLIRHSDFSFSRPLSHSEIVDQIESGLIRGDDEICAASSYWFSIQEIEEVKKHFGDIHLKALLPGGSEITSTTLNLTTLSKIDETPRASKTEPKVQAKPKTKPKTKSNYVSSVTAPLPLKPVELEADAALSKRAQAMGWLLVFIFFGTLGLLWWGSQ